MDGIVDIDLIQTGQILKLDRIVILRIKYDQLANFNQQNQILPQALIEIAFNWENQTEKKEINYSENITYQLYDSALISHSWKVAPRYTKIEGKKQLQELNIESDIQAIFPRDVLESLLIIPLFRQREQQKIKPIIIGFLILQNYQKRTWQLAEIELGKWIAKQIATSIINQQTIEKVQSLVDERTLQLKVSLDVQAKLSQKMRHHIEELKRLNHIKDEFISSLSDALKTPLSNMKMGIKMLKLVNQEEKNLKYLNILEDECEKEINLVNNLLTLEKIQANQLNIEPEKIDLKPLINNLYEEFSQTLHYQQIKLNIECELDHIYTDLNSISLIIKELINNASKFSVRDTEIKLQIYAHNKHNIIKIDNYGTKIEDDELTLIFEPFYQGKHVENVTNSGTGLGLALVKSLVENLNGTINVTSIPNSNSSVYFNTFTLQFSQLFNLVHET